MPKHTPEEIEAYAQNLSRWEHQFRDHTRVLCEDVEGTMVARAQLESRVDPKYSIVKPDVEQRKEEISFWEDEAQRIQPKNLDDHMYGASVNFSMMLSTVLNEFDHADDVYRCLDRMAELTEQSALRRQKYQNLGNSRAQKTGKSRASERGIASSHLRRDHEPLKRPSKLSIGQRLTHHERDALCDDPILLANKALVLQAELEDGIFYKVTGYSTRAKTFKIIYESCSAESHVTVEEMGSMLDNSHHVL